MSAPDAPLRQLRDCGVLAVPPAMGNLGLLALKQAGFATSELVEVPAGRLGCGAVRRGGLYRFYRLTDAGRAAAAAL